MAMSSSTPHWFQSPSGRVPRTSSVENNAHSNNLPLNDHLHLKNHRPMCSSSDGIAKASPSMGSKQISSFFLMITGSIESATAITTNEQLYCRYTFSHGPDWEAVHGASIGLSQIARHGTVESKRRSVDGTHEVVWNFPIEISFQSTNPTGWPRLVLSVYGIDYHGRDVLLGYASMMLPINPGRCIRCLRTFRPVSGGKCQAFLNWLMGKNPEYYDSKMVAKGEGRAVTRVVSEEDRAVRVNLYVTRKDFNLFGYTS